MQPSRGDSYIVTILQYLNQICNHGRNWQKVCEGTFAIGKRKVVNQTIAQNPKYVHIWDLEEMERPFEITWSDTRQKKIQTFRCQTRRAMRVGSIPSVRLTLTTIENQ